VSFGASEEAEPMIAIIKFNPAALSLDILEAYSGADGKPFQNKFLHSPAE